MAQDNSQYGNFSSQQFSNSNEIDAFFQKFGFSGFVNWFNSKIKSTSSWTKDYLGNSTNYSLNQLNWNIVWNNIQLLTQKNSVNLIEFLCLNSIIINETGGTFKAVTEFGSPEYCFDKKGGKKSYNLLSGNKTAYACFNDPNYIRVNGTKPGNSLKNTTDISWQGDTFPPAYKSLSTDRNGGNNGFIIEADFFKFRGRGYIQLTSRPNYQKLVNYVLSYSGNDTSVLQIQSKWKQFGKNSDVILTCSQNSEWDSLFGNKNYSLALWSVGNYLTTHYRKPLPINPNSSPNGLQSSILNFGASISGGDISGKYPQLFYQRVIAQLNLINSYNPNSTPMPIMASETQTTTEAGRLERTGQDPNSQVSSETTGNVSSITNIFAATAKPDPIKFDLK